jgi:hypothetical protein
MAEREGINCSDLIDEVGVHKVYAGYQDPSQEPGRKKYHIEITRNPKLNAFANALILTRRLTTGFFSSGLSVFVVFMTLLVYR